jgi:transcriptional regulator with XRE-family HTH domain
MDARTISANALAAFAKKLGYSLGQTTISRILRGEQDPTLQKVYALAEALGMPAWALFIEAGQIEQRVIRPAAIPRNVVRLPSPYPPMVQKRENGHTGKKSAEKKKR